jgi:PhoPQ-activated pathogenicity-related protein
MTRLIHATFVCLILCGGVSAGNRESTPPDSLQKFVDRPEPRFAWNEESAQTTENGTIRRLHLVSQEWQGIVWEHTLQVYEPKKLDCPKHILLFVTGGRIGGKPKDDESLMYLQLANWCGARVASVHQVPNQPLFGDHVEDDLITETWLKYLETGDESWPLLFPMVKSAVKAMDAVEQCVAKQGGEKIEGFVITGGSKRGWTSWLTPLADKRIVATAPIVINTLNFPAQMKYQIDTWGAYSEQIADYTSKGLIRKDGDPRTPREEHLWRMMDPYIYRANLSLPKFLIVGTNDPYWVVDAMNLYWDGLVGPKYTLQVPNVGHNLGDGRMYAMQSLAAYFRHQALHKDMPKVDWTFSESDGKLNLRMTSAAAPKTVLLWSTTSSTKDFRESKWTSQPLDGRDGAWQGDFNVPAETNGAVFGEFQFDMDGLQYSLTTQAYRSGGINATPAEPAAAATATVTTSVSTVPQVRCCPPVKSRRYARHYHRRWAR